MDSVASINNKRYILCATDDNYAPYCGIMLTSLLENNPGPFHVYIAHDGSISNKNRRRLDKLAKRYGVEIILKEVDAEPLDRFPLNKRLGRDGHSWVTLPTYFRLLAAEILPPEAHSVLYLDCDIIVNGDISSLWDIDLSGKALAGCPDDYSSGNCKRLNYPPEFGYINAGVSLYNLDYWRENDVFGQFATYAEKHREELLMMDQDIINGVFWDRKLTLLERFNFLVSFLYMKCWSTYSKEYMEHLRTEEANSVIIHYDTEAKPWDFHYFGFPFRNIWHHYKKVSPWSNSRFNAICGEYLNFIFKRVFFTKRLKQKRAVLWAWVPE